MAEVMPPALQLAIAKVKQTFYDGMGSAMAADVMGVCPVVIPKVNLVNLGWGTCPGIGKLNMLAYEKAGHPVMTCEGWWRFAKAIAERDLSHLKPVFDLATVALAGVAPLEPTVEVSREEEDALFG